MQNKSHYRFIVSLLLIWPLFSGCYSYLATSGCPFYNGPNQKYFENLIGNSHEKLDDHFKYQLASDSELRFVGLNPKEKDKAKADALAAPLLLSFIWFSDVHFRQHDLKLGSKIFSGYLDFLVSTTERNPAQEDFLWAVYFSQIMATNQLHRDRFPDRPLDFMIHTGDSIDAGSIEELYQFIYISDRLKIPWLNLVGNHDATILGNYLARLGYGRDPDVIFYPVGELGDFVWMHREKREISGFGRNLLLVPAESAHEPSVNRGLDKKKKLPRTSHHGFDLQSGKACSDSPLPIPDYDKAGHYAADLCEIPIPVRLIALNSSKKDKMGAKGSITPEQRDWLQTKLLPAGRGINLVFVHHRQKEFDAETQALLAGPDVGALVVFTGHDHKHHIKQHDGQNGRGYYELNTGSVPEFPQIGRLIELRGTPGGPVWLISHALWNSLMTVRVKDMPKKEVIEDFLKECIINEKIAKNECSKKEERRNAKRETLSDAVRCGHYGAYLDYLKNREKIWRFWGRSQLFDKAWEAANVIILVSPNSPVTKLLP